MIKYKYILLIVLLFQFANSQSQKTRTISSKVLDEDREIKVALPLDYSNKNKYPVIYITDANNNFEIVSSYLNQLIKFNAIPKTILVGISQKNIEDELDVFWNENGIKFKDFIFNEVVHYIDEKYSTSGFNTIIGYSNGAEYNHLLMIEENNPFRGFINISENLNNDVSNNISNFFKTYNGEKLYYFIASGKYDQPDRIKAGKLIENTYSKLKNIKIDFQNKLYKADHESILSKSLIDGISFIFKDYRNLESYNGFKDFIENYKINIEKLYGFSVEEDAADFDYFFTDILDRKDLKMYDYIIKHSNSNNTFNISSYNKACQYYQMNEYSKSITYWEEYITKSNETEPKIFYSNFKKAIDSYLILDTPKKALAFLKKCNIIFPQYELTFNYFIAKIALEYNIDKNKGKKSLKYCIKNYTKNKYFKAIDLHKLTEI